MATTDEQPQTRFRVDLTGPQGRIVSSHRTDSEKDAVRAFAKLAKTDFGKDLGRGANVALVDNEQRLDAAKVAEGHGVYNMRFLREEGRAAYEAIQPSPPGVRYPVDLSNKARKATLYRSQAQSQASRNTSSPDRTVVDGLASPNRPASQAVVHNEMTAHQAQPDDDARTAALRKQVLDALTSGRSADKPAVTDGPKQGREVLGRASEAELVAYAAARAHSLEAAQQVLDTAQKRIGGELETSSSAQRRSLPPVEDRFNVIQRTGIRIYQFRDQPEKVAFTERWLSMATALNNAAVVKAMVDRAEERGWTGLRLTGGEEFKRQAWIAAEARGIKAVGYAPTQTDQAASKQEALRLSKEQPDRAALGGGAGGTMTREGARATSGSLARSGENRHESVGQPLREAPATGYAQVMGELERAMALKGVPEMQRASARTAVQRELDVLASKDKAAKVKLYDPAASRQAPREVSKRPLRKAEPDRVR